jgi:plasmid maintenance system killer protein
VACRILIDYFHQKNQEFEKYCYHSIRINDHWRIFFKWETGDAYDVEIADYH